jgi:hypothetical protein
VGNAAKQVGVWVPETARREVKALAAAEGSSPTAVFLRLFDDQYDRLDDVFLRRRRTSSAMGPTGRRRRRRNVEEGQLWLFLTERQLEVLEEAVARTEAGSRSAFASRILQVGLDEARKEPRLIEEEPRLQ